MRRAWKALIMAAAMAAMVMTGCIGTEDLENQSANVDPLVDELLELREDQGFTIDTPVQVVLIGFQSETDDALQDRLGEEEVLHQALSYTRDFPPGSGEPVDADDLLVPVIPHVMYDVDQVTQETADAFFTFVAENPVEDAAGVYDANAAEDELSRLLPEAGITISEDTPTFVVLHDDGRLGDDHAWRFTYPNGDLEPVRAFGERTPLLVYDASAKEDPYVVGADGENDVPAYNFKQSPGGDETLDALEELTVDATHYRLAKGAIYPITPKPCHHVTLVLAVHQTALTELAPDHQEAEAWVDVAAQEAAFENATGDRVDVDFATLMLPQDDPILDATTRRAAGATESGVFLDTMRWYLDQNWEEYVDPSDECEDYLSLLLYADASSEVARGFSGIGMYDVNTDRRITFSVVTDAYRLENGYEGPGGDLVGYDEDREPDYVNRLFSHETGHILGLHHPQHLLRADGEPSPTNSAFESVWSSMSYQVSDRTIDFGTIDKNQFERNRAGYIIQHAQRLGLEETPAFGEALDHLGLYHWEQAYDVLEERVNADLQASTPDQGILAHHGGHHWHPGR